MKSSWDSKLGGILMNKKMGLVLLVGIILGGAGMIYYNAQGKMTMGQATEQEEVKQKLCTLEGNVVRIEIKNNEMTVLQKEHQNWINPEHMNLTYNWQLVHEWLTTIRNIQSKEAIYKVEDEVQYGIDDEAVMITLYDEMNRSQTFKIGKVSDNKQSLYIMTDRMQGVYVVDYTEGQPFLADPNAFVIGDLKVPERSDIEEIRVTRHEEATYSLQKSQALGISEWFLGDYYKGQYLVKEEAVENLLSAIDEMKIESFAGVMTDEKDYGLSNPQFILNLNSEWQLSFGKTEGDKVYVRIDDQPVVYTMKKECLEKLAGYKPFEMLSRELLDLPLSSLKQIVLENPQDTYQLLVSQNGQEGQVANEMVSELDGIALSKEETAEILSTIGSSIRIEAALQNPEIEQKEERKAEITITCTLQNGQEEKIELIPYDINYYILRENGITEFAVNKDKVMKLFNSLSQIKKQKK